MEYTVIKKDWSIEFDTNSQQEIEDYIKSHKDTMKFWIARDFDGKLALHTREPYCPFYTWYSGDEVALNEELFPEVTFENSPQQVEIKLVKEE